MSHPRGHETGGPGRAGRAAKAGLASWLTRRLGTSVRGFALYIISVVVGMTFFDLMTSTMALIVMGIGVVLVPATASGLRTVINGHRRRVAAWTGVEIPVPYRPVAAPPDTGGGSGAVDGLTEPSLADQWRRCARVLRDPATWRDLLWSLVDPYVGAVTAALPILLVLYGLFGFAVALPPVWEGLVGSDGDPFWYAFLPVTGQATALLAIPVGAAQIALGLAAAPALMRAYGRWCRSLLAPTDKARLELRVQRLTETRLDAVDAQAAELRRIERDLHDGAQARLVAMGMSLAQIEHLLERDPEKAKLLLTQARESSAEALRELRALVRGIHPPVLADRGLADAVRTLALEHPLRVEVTADLPGRFDAPMESAAYFAVAELLTNVTKHAGAQRVWIELGYTDGRLRIMVTDDGHGGASVPAGTDAGDGSGLLGIERRLATFDGVLAVSSPPGGPTIVTLELPCALSSPRTSLS